jgi:tRNA(Ile)-lysidine synthetase-like protein
VHWSNFLKQLQAYISTECLIDSGDSVLVAVSGGIDSVMLLEAMVALRESLCLKDIGVVYVDHGLRPEQTPAEAQWVEQLAMQHQLSFYVRYINCKDPSSGSIQTAARSARRNALLTLAQDRAFDRIALGHHADDQAETILFRLLRGTGPSGLSGILPRMGIWIHPLLAFSRKQLLALATERKISWLEDPSNSALYYTRNRIRHELLPNLEQSYNPKFRHHLNQLAIQMRDDEQLLEQMLDKQWQHPLITVTAQGLRMDLRHWDLLPPSLQWRSIRRAIRIVLRNSDLQRQHLQQIIDLARQRYGEKSLYLPHGLNVCRLYHLLEIYHNADVEQIAPLAAVSSPIIEVIGPSTDQANLTTIAEICASQTIITKPGRYTCPNGTLWVEDIENIGKLHPPEIFNVGNGINLLGCKTQARCIDQTVDDVSASRDILPPNSSPVIWELYLPHCSIPPIAPPWMLRYRLSGDLLNFDLHHRPLKKWMIDVKIPKSLRQTIPLLAQCKIIYWVIGWLYTAPLQLTAPSRGWRLRFESHTSFQLG